jgi:VWFA-related protein
MSPRWPTLLALCAVAVTPAQQPTFSLRTEIVRIDALVTQDRRPVAGLTKADFEVFDEGVRQEVDFVSSGEMPLNVVMAVDMSGSITGEREQHVRSAVGSVIDALKGDDRAALVSFATSVSVRSLTNDREQLRAALMRRQPGVTDTSLIDASYSALVLADGETGRSLVMVFSDGVDTASFLKAPSVLKTARRIDAVVYGITAATGSSKGPTFVQDLSAESSTFLRDLSADTGGRLLNIDSTARLQETLLRILEEFRHRYLIGFRPRGVPGTGWHRLQVRVKGRSVRVDARPGYVRGG